MDPGVGSGRAAGFDPVAPWYTVRVQPHTRRQRMYFFDDYVAQIALDVHSVPHKHGVLQLSVTLDGTPHEVGPAHGQVSPGLIHLVGSNQPHVLNGCGGQVAVFWISAESTLGSRLTHAHLQDGPFAVLSAGLVKALPCAEFNRAFAERWPAEAFLPVCEELLSTLAGQTPRTNSVVHPGVRKAVRIIGELDVKKIAAAELARRAGVSESRLMHLFKTHMGTPLRPYLQWLRVLDAIVAMLRDGRSVTDAAIGAGFSDGAHFNRVMNQFFAVNPSSIADSPIVIEAEFFLRERALT